MGLKAEFDKVTGFADLTEAALANKALTGEDTMFMDSAVHRPHDAPRSHLHNKKEKEHTAQELALHLSAVAAKERMEKALQPLRDSKERPLPQRARFITGRNAPANKRAVLVCDHQRLPKSDIDSLAWILHEGDTMIPINTCLFIVLQEKIDVFEKYSLYLNGFLTNLASILAQNLSNHSYGYALRDFEQASLPY